MFYKVNKAALYAFAGVSLAAMAGTASADVLVTSSTGNAAREYPRGTRLGDSQTILLRRGDTVTVLTSSGTRRWRGPGRFNASTARQRSGSVLARSGTSSVRARTGVSRGPNENGEEYPARTAWQIDITQSGAVCFTRQGSLALWRPTADEAHEITITRRADNASETVIFASGQVTHAWPTAFQASDGAEYWINYDGNIVATRVTFAELSADPDDQVAVGEAMHSNNCDGQLDALVTQAENDEENEDDAG